MSPSWIWSDKITNERVARVGYNHFISNEGEWNNCFSKFSNRVLPPIFISTITKRPESENLAHYFPYDVKLRLLAHSRSFLANQKARNAKVGAENLLKADKPRGMLVNHSPAARGLRIVRVFHQHPKWFISLYPIENCGLLPLYNNSEDARIFRGFTGTITHSCLTNQSARIDLVII